MAVDQATVDMSAAQVEALRVQAMAKVVTAKEETAKVATVEKEARSQMTSSSGSSGTAPATGRPSANTGGSSGGGGNSAEASLYGDIGLTMLGAGGAGTLMQFADQMRVDSAASGFNFTPQAGKTDGIMGHGVRTMDQMIGDTLRKPGQYAADVEGSTGGAGLFERAGIASSSLGGQGKDALSTWSVSEAKMSGVKLAKQLTFDVGLASEQTLQSIKAVQPQHDAMRYYANQMAPGMGLGSGPSIRPAELLSEAKKSSDDQSSWRGSAG